MKGDPLKKPFVAASLALLFASMAAAQAATVSNASQGRHKLRLGIARNEAKCSIGW